MLNKESALTGNEKNSLSDFATGYLYFGLHRTNDGWIFREWAPNATQIYLIGTFSDWKENATYAMQRIDNGNWEIKLSEDALHHERISEYVIEVQVSV